MGVCDFGSSGAEREHEVNVGLDCARTVRRAGKQGKKLVFDGSLLELLPCFPQLLQT